MSADKASKVISVTVIPFKEFLTYLPINSVGETWLGYQILWYASKCIAFVKEDTDHRNIRAIFSSRLAELKEFENFSEIATPNWSDKHKELFETVAFRTSTTSLKRFQATAARILNVDLEAEEMRDYLGWEDYDHDNWKEEFFSTLAELLTSNSISYSNGQPSAPPPVPARSSEQEVNKDETETSESEGTQTDEDQTPIMHKRMLFAGQSKLLLEMNAMCTKISSMMKEVESNLESLARVSAAVKVDIETGFTALFNSNYNAHAGLVRLLKKNWECLPATMQVATPKVLVDAISKDPLYRALREESSDDEDKLVLMETIWNNHLLKLIHTSGNFDERVSKSRFIRVEEVAKEAAKSTLAAAGMDDNWPSLLRGLSSEIKQMNVQRLSTSKSTSSGVEVPGSVVAKTSEEAKRLLAARKAEKATSAGPISADLKDKYIKMSGFDLIGLDPEEREIAMKVRMENSK